MKKFIFILLLAALCATPLHAQKQTFTRDYTYQASEEDSKNSARANATTQMRNILLREVGEFLHTERKSASGAYSETIEAITAGIVEMKTLDERWDGHTYYIKAEMTVDPKDLERRIAEVLNDKQKTRELEDARKRTLAAEAEAARLKKELEKTKDEQQRLALQKTYRQVTETLSAEEYFSRGRNAAMNDLYELAIEYYQQAIDIDPNLADAYLGMAYAYYNLQDYQDAISNFESSLACSRLIGKTDTMVIYYVGLIARVAGDNHKALEYFGKALDLGYDQNGDLYAAQAEVLQALGDTATSVQLLVEGLAKYPTNQSIIIRLINTFLQQGDDLKKILPYIEQAQQNDPDNSSLYYAQGVVYEQLEDFDNAVSAYKKSLKKDKNNFYSNYALGAFYFNKAVQIQNVAAMEPDDMKYVKMIEEVDAYFDLSLPYIERAYELNNSEIAVLEALKSLYFRLREKSPKMQKKYEYFSSKLQEIQQ